MISDHQRRLSSHPASRQLPAVDVTLLDRMAKGDGQAAGVLVDRWASSLYSLTDGLRMDRTSGDAVVAEVFRRMLFEAPRFVARPEKFFDWLKNTARDCASAVLLRRSAPTRPARKSDLPNAGAHVAESCSAMLREARLPDALQYLNSLTPYRFTAIYRFDGLRIRNVHMFDRIAGWGSDGSVSATSDTYCLWIQESLTVVQMGDSLSDSRAIGHPKREIVRSYCGGPICDTAGSLLGTICHFDYETRSTTPDVLAALQAVSPLLVAAVAID